MAAPGPIDVVDLIYSHARAEREKHKRERGVVWVTDLVRCPLKATYEELYPELSLQDVFKPSLIVGALIHRGLEGLLRELVRGFVVETEVEESKEVMLRDGSLVTVRGRLDVVLSGDFGRVAVEIKSSRSDRGIPQRHHVDQVRGYNWLADLTGSILLYVTPTRIAQFYVEDRMDTSEVVDRATSKKAPRYGWECAYCAYSVMCPSKTEA